MMFDVRAVAYEPGGDRVGVLPDSLTMTLTVPRADTPTVALTYPAGDLGVRGELLDSEVEVAIEYTTDGDTWQEPPGARFLSQKSSTNLLDDGTTSRSLTAVHVSNRLSEALVWEVPDGNQDSDGKFNFLSANAGVIIRTLWDKAVARGWGAGLSVDFDTNVDSAGAEWAKVVTIAVDPTVSLATVMTTLVNMGMCDVSWDGRTMRVFNADTTLDEDKSDTVFWPLWQEGNTSAPETVTWSSLCTDVLVKGDGNHQFLIHNDDAPASLRRIEKVVSAGGVTLEETAKLIAAATLASGAYPAEEVERDWQADAMLLTPFVDYRPGDWISVERSGGRESLRVAQVSVTKDANGVSGHTTFGTKLDDVLTRLAKKTQGINGGATVEGARAADTSNDTRILSTPRGLTATGDLSTASDGTFTGVVTCSWAPVSTATVGTAMTPTRYEVRAFYGTSKPQQSMIVPSSDTQVSFVCGVIGDVVSVQVRALGEATYNNSEFSEPLVEVTIPQPAQIAPPSAPTVTGGFGMATIKWDGLLANGANPGTYFDHVVVQEASSTSGPFTKVGSIRVASLVLDKQANVGATFYYRFVAVDSLGRESEPSAVTSFTVTWTTAGQVTSDMLAAGSVTAGKIAAAAVSADNLQAGSVTADAVTASEELWAKVAEFGAVTTEMLTAGGAQIDGSAVVGALSGNTLRGGVVSLTDQSTSTSSAVGYWKNYLTQGATGSAGFTSPSPSWTYTSVTSSGFTATVKYVGQYATKNDGLTGGLFYTIGAKMAIGPVAAVGPITVSVTVTPSWSFSGASDPTNTGPYLHVRSQQGHYYMSRVDEITANKSYTIAVTLPEGEWLNQDYTDIWIGWGHGAKVGDTLKVTNVNVVWSPALDTGLKMWRDAKGMARIDIADKQGNATTLSSSGVTVTDNSGNVIGTTSWQSFVAPPIAVGYNRGTQSTPNGSWVRLNTSSAEPRLVGGVTYSSQAYKVPLDGLYQVTGWAQWTGNTSGRRAIVLYVNGASAGHWSSDFATDSTFPLEVNEIFTLSKGDTVALYATQNSGGGADGDRMRPLAALHDVGQLTPTASSLSHPRHPPWWRG